MARKKKIERVPKPEEKEEEREKPSVPEKEEPTVIIDEVKEV